MSLVRVARGILSLLSPLTGTRASGGVVRLFATAAPVLLSARCPMHLVPVIEGQIRPDLVFETVGDATVEQAGTDVPIRAHLGGTYGNRIPAGAEVVVLPPEPGLEARGTCITPPSGGTSPAAGDWRALRMARLVQELRPGRPGEDILRGGLLEFPAVALAWAGFSPYDGAKPSRNQIRYLSRWQLFVLASDKSGGTERGLEALDLVDAVQFYIEGATTTDTGEVLTATGTGIQVDTARPFLVAPGALAHVITLRGVASYAIDGLRRRAAPVPWLETFLEMTTTEPTSHADDPKTVVSTGWDQPQDP